jgi:hypothetical protein
MPGLSKQMLTQQGKRRLATAQARVDKAEGGLADAREAWAALVRELGISAVARELDLTAQAVAARVKYIEDHSRR